MKRVLTSHFLLLSFALVIALVFRLYKLSTPLADWHSWRQADTVSVTREFVKHNYPILYPHFQDLSNIPSGKDNLEGYRMVEFPIINYVIAQVIRWKPSLNIVVVSRLFSIGFSLITLVALYTFTFRVSKDKTVSFLSAIVFAALPYTVYYSRTALPEAGLVMAEMVAMLGFLEWVYAIKTKALLRQVFWTIITFLSFALALLLKPVAIFLVPVLVVLALYQLKFKSLKHVELWIVLAATFVPLMWWRTWITHFPSGIPASDWLFNGNGIRLRPAWWRWIFADRLGRLILGYWGTVFFFLGFVITKTKKQFSFFDVVTWTWTLCMFGYLVVIATGNVQHDYYQYMLTPMISVLLGRGMWSILKLSKEYALPVVIYPVALLVLCLMAYFSWYEVSGYYNINNPAIVSAGKAVDQFTPPNARVIAPYQGDTAFLFQTNRTGWPIGNEIDKKIKQGAQYYVTTTYDNEARTLEQKYTTVQKTSEYIILDLTRSVK